MKRLPEIGDYVIATKYNDGDPGDHFCVGYYSGNYDHYGETRHLVVDSDGKNFRANGFRRCERLSRDRGNWIVSYFWLIEFLMDRHSVWFWVRIPRWRRAVFDRDIIARRHTVNDYSLPSKTP